MAVAATRRSAHSRRGAPARRRRENVEHEWIAVSDGGSSTWRPISEQGVLASLVTLSSRTT